MSMSDDLRQEVRDFLAESKMSPGYFGLQAVKNGRLVERLEEGKTITLKSAERIRTFIAKRREERGQP
jgi:hypothetical protein